MRKKNVLKLLVIGILIFTAVLLQKVPAEAASDPDNNIFDISEGNITVAATGSAIQVTYGASQSKVIAASEEITIAGATTSNCIAVNGVAANITLNTVDIQLSTADICAFALTGGANVTLTLKDGTTNILKSGANKAGLQVNLGQTLTILGLGKLTVTGGFYGAGIGGSYSSNNSSIFMGGTISIQSGEVIAQGGSRGAGIGGGLYGNGGTIIISGGNVTAIGGDEAAGIGGGGQGSGGNISITGGVIRAVGGSFGAGIGDGNCCSGTNNIRIENATVIALGGFRGAGIGGSNGGSGATGDTITISDTAIIKAASDGTSPAIYADSNTLASGSTASILLITPTSALPANTNVSVYYKSPYSLYTSYNPTIGFKSIAISIPTISTYGLTIGGIQQKNATGTDYIVSAAGITLFSSSEATDEAKVATDKAILTDSLIKGSNTDLSNVTGALAVLPTAGSMNASAITWSSSNPSILSNDGQTVIRPAYGTGDATVTLTATITKGIVTDTKVFNITVLAETVNPDIAKVAADKAALTDSVIKGTNVDLSHVTGTLAALPTAGSVNASAITWSSSNPSILSNDGQTVARPAYGTGDATVTLTATLIKGIVTDTKVFNITVLAETVNPDIAKVAADKAALTDNLIKGSNPDLSHVTVALVALPTAGSVNASVITWSSSNPSILSNDGQTVVRPAYGTGDASVTLTATITKGTVTDTKVYNLIVKAFENSNISSGASGTTSISTPVVTPTPMSEASITLNSENDISVMIKCTEEDINSSKDYILPIPVDKVKTLILDENANNVMVSVLLPKYEGDEETQEIENSIVLDSELLELIKASDKTLTIKIIDDTSKEIYRWVFDKNNLGGVENNLENIKLSLHVNSLAELTKLNKVLNQEHIKGFLISFNQNSVLPAQATVSIYVGNIEGIKPGSKVYVYRNNQKTGKLEDLPHSSHYSVSEEGYITMQVIDASDYVIVNSKAPSNLTKSLLSQVEVTLNNSVLYIDKTNKNKIKFNVTLPATLEIVKNIDKNANISNAVGELTITYYSSNKKVAVVDKNGTITAVGKGKVLVTAKITLYNGKTKVVKMYITVK